MKVQPFGMVDAAQNEAHFDPTKPVRPCFWDYDGGWAIGFTQHVGGDRYYGGLFQPRMRPVGRSLSFDCIINSDRFECAYEAAYGIKPVLDDEPRGYESPCQAVQAVAV